MSSTDAADRLFESIEDETLPIMDDSSPENSESSGKDAKQAENMDDSINKDIEEIEDTEIVAGNLDVDENVNEGVMEKSKSPTPDVVPQVDEFNKDSEDVKPITASETPSKSDPVITSTPAKEMLDTKTNTPASASKSQKELELEEYRAKLAEKRRQAREKAEREAEIERQKQEQLRYLIEIIIIHNAS